MTVGFYSFIQMFEVINDTTSILKTTVQQLKTYLKAVGGDLKRNRALKSTFLNSAGKWVAFLQVGHFSPSGSLLLYFTLRKLPKWVALAQVGRSTPSGSLDLQTLSTMLQNTNSAFKVQISICMLWIVGNETCLAFYI